MIRRTRSVACPPICHPQLPPPILKTAGALQLLPLLYNITPCPYFAPKMKPPESVEGKMATALHFLSISFGIAVSGIEFISLRTFDDSTTRSSHLSAYAREFTDSNDAKNKATTRKTNTLFMLTSFHLFA